MKTVLKNGIIMDGSGEKSFKGSVILEDQRILDILPGTFDDTSFDGKSIDCSGKIIAPGFIDAHSHNDWFAHRKNPVPYFKSFLEQGITCQVTGNCGFSPFGYEKNSPYTHLLGSGLFETGEVQGDYSSFQGWSQVAENFSPLNIVPLLGHGSVRIGLAAYENRQLTVQEQALHDAKIEEAFDEGVYGLSLGLMYEPDRYADFAELEAAAKIVAKRGGVLTVHSRAQSAASTSYGSPVGGEAHNIRALKEMIELTRRTGVRMQYSHQIFVGESTWKTVDKSLELIDKARSEGLDFAYDLYSMTFGVSVITVVLPSWFLSIPENKRSHPVNKFRLSLEIMLTKKLLGFGFSDIEVAWAGEAAKDLCGKRISDLAREWDLSELEAYIKVVDTSQKKGRVNMYKYYNEAIIQKLIKHEPSIFMTDAWIEKEGIQNAAAFSCFPRFLELSRTGKTISLEKTIRKMSGATADRFHIADRAYIRKGYFADLTIFDPETIAPGKDLLGRPIGISEVFVNGRLLVSQGIAHEEKMTGAGTILKYSRS